MALVFVNLTKKRHKTRTYVHGEKQVSGHTIRKWASELPEMVTEKDGIENKL